jgi:hypothetical protein
VSLKEADWLEGSLNLKIALTLVWGTVLIRTYRFDRSFTYGFGTRYSRWTYTYVICGWVTTYLYVPFYEHAQFWFKTWRIGSKAATSPYLGTYVLICTYMYIYVHIPMYCRWTKPFVGTLANVLLRIIFAHLNVLRPVFKQRVPEVHVRNCKSLAVSCAPKYFCILWNGLAFIVSEVQFGNCSPKKTCLWMFQQWSTFNHGKRHISEN